MKIQKLFLFLAMAFLIPGCGLGIKGIQLSGSAKDQSGMIAITLNEEDTKTEGDIVLEAEKTDGTTEKLYTYSDEDLDKMIGMWEKLENTVGKILSVDSKNLSNYRKVKKIFELGE